MDRQKAIEAVARMINPGSQIENTELAELIVNYFAENYPALKLSTPPVHRPPKG